MIETAVSENGTKPEVDALTAARDLIAKDIEARLIRARDAVEAENCGVQAVVQIGDQYRVLNEIGGLPVLVQFVAK